MGATPGNGSNNSQQLAVSWVNVGYAGIILLIDVAICIYFKLGVAQNLIIAALRCIIQLSLLGLILDSVFSSESPIAVCIVTLALVLLGANEVTVVRASKHSKGLVGTIFEGVSYGYSISDEVAMY